MGFSLNIWAHQMSFFQLAPISGAVDSGVNKAMQTVGVFIAADWAFCDAETNPRACFSTQKGQSLVLVVGGVLLYSYFSGKAKHQINHGTNHGSLKDRRKDETEARQEELSLLVQQQGRRFDEAEAAPGGIGGPKYLLRGQWRHSSSQQEDSANKGAAAGKKA